MAFFTRLFGGGGSYDSTTTTTDKRHETTPSLPNPFGPYSTLTSSSIPCSSSRSRSRSPSTSPRSSICISPCSSPSPSPSGRHQVENQHLPFRRASTLLTIEEVDSNASTITSRTGLTGMTSGDSVPRGHFVGKEMRSTLGTETVGTSSGDEEGVDDEEEEDEEGETSLSISPRARRSSQHSHRSHLSSRSQRSHPADLENEDVPPVKWYKAPLFDAGIKLGILFVLFTAVLGGTLWFGVPRLDDVDKPAFKIPKSFKDLQALNTLFQKYKGLYPAKILACGVVMYLFVQAFSLPGSMYISIIFGAAYGIMIGLALSCLCEAFGALLCYTLSAIVGPPLLTIPAYRRRLETWRVKIMGDESKGERVGWDGVFAFLIVLRIAPFPPHWVANVVAPHLGISPLLFWLACFIGIAPVSVIHVTIGSGLDSMTSAEDFHILSLRNVLGLVGVGVAVLIPVGLKRVFKKDLSGLSDAEAALTDPHGAKITLDEELASDDSQTTTSDEPYYPGDRFSYQAQDSGVMLSPPQQYLINEADGNIQVGRFTSRDKGKGRADLGLQQALDIIRNDGDEEVVAVVYDDDLDDTDRDKLEGLYEEVEDREEDDEDEEQALYPIKEYPRYARTKSYGTIPGREEDEVTIKQRKAGWWKFWR